MRYSTTNAVANSGPGRIEHARGPWVRGPHLQQRDIEILCWIARNGVVTPSLIAHRFFWRPQLRACGVRAARHRLTALSRLGLIVRDRNPYAARDPRGNREAVIRVSREGARVADVGLRPAPLVISELRHTLALAQLCNTLLVNNPTAELVTERELRADRYRATRDGNHEPGHGRIADAILRIPTGRTVGPAIAVIAVELDTSRKDARAMERMLRAYDHEDIDRLWWFVAPSRVQRTRDFVREMHRDTRVRVFPWPG